MVSGFYRCYRWGERSKNYLQIYLATYCQLCDILIIGRERERESLSSLKHVQLENVSIVEYEFKNHFSIIIINILILHVDVIWACIHAYWE